MFDIFQKNFTEICIQEAHIQNVQLSSMPYLQSSSFNRNDPINMKLIKLAISNHNRPWVAIFQKHIEIYFIFTVYEHSAYEDVRMPYFYYKSVWTFLHMQWYVSVNIS